MQRSTRIILMAAGIGALALVMLALTGVFRGGVIEPDGAGGERAAAPASASARLVNAERRQIPEYHYAAGTVKAREKAALSAQLSARVVRVLVQPGARVAAGDLLIELDRRDLAARLQQVRAAALRFDADRQRAGAAVTGARAGLTEARAHYQRTQSYFKQKAATRQQLEQAESRYRQAEAGVRQAEDAVAAAEAGLEQARQAVSEAEVAFGYGLIHAPQAGQVVERLVDPGDLAAPGRPLITLQQSESLRFEAAVPESLIAHTQPGARLMVRIEAAGLDLDAPIEELVPAADPASRSFLVKLAVPNRPGLYPGMFGRLRIELGERPAVLVPAAAIRRIGQLELVTLEENGRRLRLYVKTGAVHDGLIEVLSGLDGSERLVVE